jgi:hypothetical protein
VDGGDDAQPAATARTGEDIEIEHAAHQHGPGPDGRADDRAAERFFGQTPRSTFAAILASVEIPPAPLTPPRHAVG